MKFIRKHLLQIIGLAALCTAIYSCKLDKPILPGDPGYIAVTPPGGGDGGTGGGSTTIVTSDLPGTWKVTTLSTIIYSDGAVATNSPSLIVLFNDVKIDDVAKTAVFDGAFNFSGNTTYTMSTTGGKSYFQFSEDPFSRSSNGPVQLVSLSATSMTWIALDPLQVTSDGHKIQSAWEVTYTKQ